MAWQDLLTLDTVKTRLNINGTEQDAEIEELLDLFVTELSGRGFDFTATETETTRTYSSPDFVLQTSQGQASRVQIGAWTSIKSIKLNGKDVELKCFELLQASFDPYPIIELEKSRSCCGHKPFFCLGDTLEITGVYGYSHDTLPRWLNLLFVRSVRSVLKSLQENTSAGQYLKSEKSLTKAREYTYNFQEVQAASDDLFSSASFTKYINKFSPYKRYGY